MQKLTFYLVAHSLSTCLIKIYVHPNESNIKRFTFVQKIGKNQNLEFSLRFFLAFIEESVKTYPQRKYSSNNEKKITYFN